MALVAGRGGAGRNFSRLIFMQIRCLLVDDEHFALALLEKFVADTPDLELVGLCRSPVRAIEILQSEPVDLLFLDIQMPVLNGLNLLRSVSRKPVTIFTTAYPQHAVDAFELDAADYLLKPYAFERFNQALEKARALLRQRRPETPGKPEGSLQIKVDRRFVKLDFSEIRYVEGWKEYVKIFTATDKFITLESLNKLENTLPAEHFIRVHKSFIVAKDQVRQMDGDDLILAGDVRVPVARARKQQVKASLFL